MCLIALSTGEENKVLTSYHMNRHRLQISNTWLATVEAGVHKPKHWEVKKTQNRFRWHEAWRPMMTPTWLAGREERKLLYLPSPWSGWFPLAQNCKILAATEEKGEVNISSGRCKQPGCCDTRKCTEVGGDFPEPELKRLYDVRIPGILITNRKIHYHCFDHHDYQCNYQAG